MLTAVVHASEMPLKVAELVTGASSHVRITNAGSQIVTAWSLVATSTEGERTRRAVYTADGYLSEVTRGIPGSSDLLNRFEPGETRQFPLDPLPPGSAVEVAAAVFDDGTAAGDEPIIEAIFARRVSEREAFRAVVDIFNDVLTAKHGRAALDGLRERFAGLLQQGESVPCRAALDAVETYSRATNPEQIDQALNTYRAFVTKEYELAVKHAHRKRS
jgi:hypothetical protein